MGESQGTGGWKSLDMSCRVRERTRLRSSWGSQEDPEKPGHVSYCRKEKGGITGSRETEEEGETSPLPRERKEENTLESGQDYRSGRGREREILGNSRKGKERGRTGRKEEVLEESPGEKGGSTGGTAGVAAPRAPRRALSTSLSLSLPQCQCPASRACMSPYASTGTGGMMAGHQPAQAQMLHPPRAADPPLFLPTCHPLQWAKPGTLLSHTAT